METLTKLREMLGTKRAPISERNLRSKTKVSLCFSLADEICRLGMRKLCG